MPIITMNEALPKINKLDIELTHIYQQHTEEHANINPLILFGEYAEYVITAIRNEKLEIAEKMLHAMEALLAEGDHDVKNAINNGFLVHMDDKIRHIITSFELFKKAMGPRLHKLSHEYEETMQRKFPLWN